MRRDEEVDLEEEGVPCRSERRAGCDEGAKRPEEAPGASPCGVIGLALELFGVLPVTWMSMEGLVGARSLPPGSLSSPL